MNKRIALALVAGSVAFGTFECRANTIGLHIGSAHLPDNGRVNNVNPGLFYRADSGATAGFYRNSNRRMSAYAGYSKEWGVLGLTAGVITGYDKRHGGHSNSPVAALVAASINGPEIFGLMPRLSYIPGHIVKAADVLHLSIERRF